MTGPRQGELLGLRVARRRLRRAPRPCGLPVRPRRVRRSEVRGLRALRPALPSAPRSRSANCATARCTRATATWCSVTRTRATRSTARSCSSLQAGHRASGRPPRHLSRTAPHLRGAHGGGGHAAAHSAALDGHADSKTTQVYAHYQPLPGFGSSPASRSASGRTHPESAGTVQKEQRVDIAGPADGETRSRPIRLPAAG